MDPVDEKPVRTHRFENAEEAGAVVPGAQVRFLPLGPPMAAWQMTDVTLGESRLLCGQMGADTSIFGELDRDLLYFLAPLSGSGWRVLGKEIGRQDLAVIANSTDIASRLGHSLHSMSLQVPKETFARAYEGFAGSALPSWSALRMFTLDAPAADDLRETMMSALRIAMHRPKELDRPHVGKVLEDLMVDRLIAAVSASSRAERPEYRLLTSRCNDYLEANADRCVTVRELRETLGVGERALRRFFASAYGTSPGKFLRIQRLHGVNRALAQAEATVTSAAMSFGFFDLGRFAGDYRRLFGEQPSETLQHCRSTGAKVAGST